MAAAAAAAVKQEAKAPQCRPLDRKAWVKGQAAIKEMRQLLEKEHVPHRGALKTVKFYIFRWFCCFFLFPGIICVDSR